MEQKCLAVIDLLGFSNMVKKDHGIARDVLSDFYNIAFKTIKPKTALKGHLFSDTLMVYSNDNAILVNGLCEIYRECLKKSKDYLNKQDFFLLPRGGVSIGIVNIENRMEAPNLKKDFIVSPALVHSSEMEKNIKGSRLLIAVKAVSTEEMSITWNASIRTILYEQSFCFWEKYQYQDALWFADLSKESTERKKETGSLIDIVIEFVKEYSKKPLILQHYADTLRIGLLSYSHLFEATMSSNLIDSLVTEFAEDRYWKIWLAIFEMAMQSPDSWAISGTRSFVDFYRKICLSKGWVKLLNEINKPSNSFLKSKIENFINDLSIRTVES
ncbi:hypothetical protein ACFL1G_02860 [Planctomycetota bacterium]